VLIIILVPIWGDPGDKIGNYCITYSPTGIIPGGFAGGIIQYIRKALNTL
jgi:hypothetical protein